YRWALELSNHAVFADPASQPARELAADSMEQLGYQAESGVWRGEYLTGAKELREGVKAVRAATQGPDVLRAMSPEDVFDVMAARLNHPKVDGIKLGINVSFTDTGEKYALELSNSVLNNTRGRVLADAAASLSLTRAALLKMVSGSARLPDLLGCGEVKLGG